MGGEPVFVAWRDSDSLASFGSGGVSIFDIPIRSQIVFILNPENLRWSEDVWIPAGTGLLASGENDVATVIQIWDVSDLPTYKSVFYQEGIIDGNVHWTNSGLFYISRGGIRRDNNFLVRDDTR